MNNDVQVISPAQRKKQLRKQLKKKRKSLTKKEQQNAGHRLLVNLYQTPAFRQAKHMAFYFPSEGEIDVTPAMLDALHRGRQCYYPILYRSKTPQLFFAPVTHNTRFKPDFFGLPEPVVPTRLWRKPSEMQAVFMPLVGFDIAGNRIGMGGGYYDASYAYMMNRTFLKRPVLIGVAHDFQKVENLNRERWDVSLHHIVTDKAVYHM